MLKIFWKRLPLIASLLIVVVPLCGCGKGDGSANRLFGEAYQLAARAEATSNNKERADLLSQALAKLSDIEARYPGSEAARLLSSEQAIAKISVKGIETLKVDAERPKTVTPPAEASMAPAPHGTTSNTPGAGVGFGDYLASLGPTGFTGLTLEGRLDFLSYQKLGHSRAFAIADSGAWGWSYNIGTIDQSVAEALRQCERSPRQYGDQPPCRLFAIGDIIVYNSLDAEQKAASDTYVANRNATNADWAANWARSATPEVVTCAREPTLDCVVDLISQSGSAQQRIDSVIDIAMALQRAGRASEASTWLQDALNSVPKLADADSRDRALSRIVATEAEADDMSAAFWNAKTISSAHWRNEAWAALALGIAKTGVLTEARTTVESIDDGDRRDQALVGIAEFLAGQLQFDSAHDFANAIHSAKRRAEAFAKIAAAQAEAHDIDGALKTTDQIGDAGWKREALIAIVGSQARAGDVTGAKRTADRIVGLPWQATVPIAEALAAAGNASAALTAAESITDIAGRAEAMVAVISALAKAGLVAAAQADAHRPSVGNRDGEAILEIVKAMAGKNDFAGALSLAKRLVHSRVFPDALIAIAAAQAAAEDRYSAVGTIEGYMSQMDTTWTGYTVWVAKQNAVKAIADAQVLSGFVPQAIATTQNIYDPVIRANVYREIATWMASRED